MTEAQDQPQFVVAGMNKAIRYVFPHVLTPRSVKIKGKETGKLKYSASFMIPPDHPDLTALKKMAAAVAKEKWPGRKLGELHFPFQDGDEAAVKAEADGKDYSFFKGHVVLKANTEFKIGAIDGRQTPPKATLDESLFYGGSYVGFKVSFRAYDGVGANPDGVTCDLKSVCFVAHGEPIGGGNEAETFKGIAGHATDENPLADSTALDDEIPF